MRKFLIAFNQTSKRQKTAILSGRRLFDTFGRSKNKRQFVATIIINFYGKLRMQMVSPLWVFECQATLFKAEKTTRSRDFPKKPPREARWFFWEKSLERVVFPYLNNSWANMTVKTRMVFWGKSLHSWRWNCELLLYLWAQNNYCAAWYLSLLFLWAQNNLCGT